MQGQAVPTPTRPVQLHSDSTPSRRVFAGCGGAGKAAVWSRSLARLQRASELLLRYCRAGGEILGHGEGRAPGHQGTDTLFLVRVAGTRSDDVEPSRFGAARKL